MSDEFWYQYYTDNMKPPYTSSRSKHRHTGGSKPSTRKTSTSRPLTRSTVEDLQDLEEERKKNLIKCAAFSPQSKQNMSGTENFQSNLIHRIGNPRGIQGHNNSCYLDVFLFSLFYAQSTFDILLQEKNDDEEIAKEVRYILRNYIVPSLRSSPYFCRAECVNVLRKHMARFDSKIMRDRMAIEDVVYILLDQIFGEPHFIRYCDNHEAYMHVMVANTHDRILDTDVQKNFEFSMMANGRMMFKKVPFPGLILSLPWHKQTLFHYTSVAPVPELNISSVTVEVRCEFCRNKAVWESTLDFRKQKHHNVKIKYRCDAHLTYETDDSVTYVHRERMMLLAVICYRGYHFTTVFRFTPESSSLDKIWENSRWLYFDSITANGPNVTDMTETFQELASKRQAGKEIWTQAFERFHLLFNVHTCVYEPIYCNPGK